MFHLFLIFLVPFPVSGAGNHPACGSGRPFHPPPSIEARIIGGLEATPHEFPWIVALDQSHSPNSYFCSGSILNEHWILTAASCLEFNYSPYTAFQVNAGKHRLTWVDRPEEAYPEAGQQIRKAQDGSIPHPKYNGFGWDYDVALIYLRKPLSPFPTATIRPICLPEPSPDIDRWASQQCITAGWGWTQVAPGSLQGSDVLKKVPGTVQSQASCLSGGGHRHNRTDRTLCFATRDKKESPCIGDNGGPLLCVDLESQAVRWTQVGIDSHGYHGCGRANAPELFTRVSEVSKWVWETIERHTP